MKWAFVVLLFSVNLFADLTIGKTGCYRFQGTVESIQGTTLKLLLFAGSDSEESISLSLNQPDPRLAKGLTVDLIANVRAQGPVSKVPLSVETDRIHILSSASLNFRRVGEWHGMPHGGTCR